MRTQWVPVIAIAALITSSVHAEPLAIGSPAPAFTKLQGVDGKAYSIEDFRAADVLVICITCNHCPVAIAYQDRIIEFAKKYDAKSGVALVAINVNDDPRDSYEKMKERAKEKGFNFPYLYDPSQQIVVQLGATVTPEFFVFNKERKLVYHGTFDDHMKPAKVTKQFVIPAVEATQKGAKVSIAKTTPLGCGIIFRKKL